MPFPRFLFLKKNDATYWFSVLCVFIFIKISPLSAQIFFSLKPADSLHQKRLTVASAIGIGTYSASMIGLKEAWYADYPRSDFHFFNDGHEWMQMDKAGHVFSAFTEARLAATAFRWTGLSQKKSAWLGAAAGQLFQASFEVLDGYSSEYGFSWGDIGCNTLGSALFLGQELAWREQRIVIKMSAWPEKYDNYPIYSVGNQPVATTLQKRADDLYGTGIVNLFLKNYNTLVIWSSFNLRSFSFKKEGHKLPAWLNIAVGHGANNLFRGAPLYEWTDKTGANFQIDPKKYPRERQFFLSLDMDLTRLKVKNRFLRTVLSVFNTVKIPAPTLELTSRGKFQVHPIYF